MWRRALVLLWSILLVAAPTPAFAGDPAVVLVAETDSGVVQLDPTTGAVLRLLVPGGHSPALSPDGRRLVFGLRAGYQQHLWVSDLDGTNRVQLTSGNAFDSAPDWSPDGRRVALCRAAALAVGFWQPRIAVVNSDGTGGHVVAGTDEGCDPTWSPDSALLAYRARDGIRVTDPDGATNELLTEHGFSPAWSPDGQTMAVTDTGSESDISLVDVRSGQSKVITEFAGYHLTWQEPVWTPDGAALYSSVRTESFPDDSGRTTMGSGIERRGLGSDRDDAFWTDGAQSPSVGGGTRPAHDAVAPSAVAATATATINAIDVSVSPQAEPDAAGAVVRYAAGDVAPATPTDGLLGGRTVRGHLRIRRLLADATYSISVFPVDWSGNVGVRTVTTTRTPHEVGTTLRMSGVPQVMFYGQSIVARGTLTREDTGAPVAGAQIELFGHLRDQPDRLLATLTTDSAGAVTSRRLPSGETRYTLRYAGSDPLLPAAVDAVTSVRTVVRAELSRAGVVRGGRVTATVRLLPAMAQLKVYVDEYVSGRLRRRMTAGTDANGQVTVRLDTSGRGTYTVTASTNGDGLRAYGISPPRTLTVR